VAQIPRLVAIVLNFHDLTMKCIKNIFLVFLFSCNNSIVKTEYKTDLVKDSKGKTVEKIETGTDMGPFKDTNARSLPFSSITYFDSLGRPIKIKSIRYNLKSLETFFYKDTLSALWTVYYLGKSSNIADTTFSPDSKQITLLKEQRLNEKSELIYEYTESKDSLLKCKESIYDSLTGKWTIRNNCR
jgi:hypothetical protein